MPYEIKDSGKRIEMGGMVRDVTTGKVDYSLVFDGPMFERWAQHLTTGAQKYAKRNWMGAYTQEEQERFKESAVRHFMQWINGNQDEDHAAAVFFNINGYEYVRNNLVNSVDAPGCGKCTCDLCQVIKAKEAASRYQLPTV